MSEDALVVREQRGNISVLTMVYRPYNLLGPKLINAIVEQIEGARDAGSRAIVLRSGLRHFSAGADPVAEPGQFALDPAMAQAGFSRANRITRSRSSLMLIVPEFPGLVISAPPRAGLPVTLVIRVTRRQALYAVKEL